MLPILASGFLLLASSFSVYPGSEVERSFTPTLPLKLLKPRNLRTAVFLHLCFRTIHRSNHEADGALHNCFYVAISCRRDERAASEPNRHPWLWWNGVSARTR